MSRENVKKFYELVANDNELGKSLNALDKEVQIKTSDFAKLKDIVEEKIIPLAKKRGLDFSADELLEYANKKYMELRDEDLLDVSGGFSPRNTAIGLASVLFLSLGTAATINLLPSTSDQSQSISSTVSNPEEENYQSTQVKNNLSDEESLDNKSENDSEISNDFEIATESTNTQTDDDSAKQLNTNNVDDKDETAVDVTEGSSIREGSSEASRSTTTTHTMSDTDFAIPAASASGSTMFVAGGADSVEDINETADTIAEKVAEAVNTHIHKIFEDRTGYNGSPVELSSDALSEKAMEIGAAVADEIAPSASDIGFISSNPYDNGKITITVTSSDDSSSSSREIDVHSILQEHNANVKKARLDNLKTKLAKRLSSRKHYDGDIDCDSFFSACLKKSTQSYLLDKYNITSSTSEHEVSKLNIDTSTMDAIYDDLQTGSAFIIDSSYRSLASVYQTDDSVIVIDKLNSDNNLVAVTVLVNTASGIQSKTLERSITNADAQKIVDGLRDVFDIQAEGSVSYTQFGRVGIFGNTATSQAKHLLETLNKISSFDQVKEEDVAGLKADIEYLAGQIKVDDSGNHYFSGRFKSGSGIGEEGFKRILQFNDMIN